MTINDSGSNHRSRGTSTSPDVKASPTTRDTDELLPFDGKHTDKRSTAEHPASDDKRNTAEYPSHDETPTTPDERNAMRAYLQRSEVRLSTLHRVAVAFISGAGLLILFPMFFKEEIVALIRVFLINWTDTFPHLGGAEQVVKLLLYVFLLYPFALSLVIPVYSMYLLIKDVVHFYFTIYTPGFPPDLITPSLALSGIGFSPDESPRLKRDILRYQYDPASINFAIPFSKEKRELYFDETIRSTNGDILPTSRRLEDLEAMEVLPVGTDSATVNRLNAAFGLARAIDRKLVEEVATTELSLVRHILYLRRLMLRYVRTLLMLIWTAIVSFIMLPFLEDQRLPTFLVLSVGYLIWSVLVIKVMRMPLAWIYRHKKGIPDQRHIDRQLVRLERQMRPLIYVSIASAVVALVLCVPLYFGG